MMENNSDQPQEQVPMTAPERASKRIIAHSGSIILEKFSRKPTIEEASPGTYFKSLKFYAFIWGIKKNFRPLVEVKPIDYTHVTSALAQEGQRSPRKC